jgi:sodium transport system permease protein
VLPIDPKPWMYAVPALGQQLLLQSAIGGQAGGVGEFVLAGASAVALSLLAVWAAARLLGSERIVFGR